MATTRRSACRSPEGGSARTSIKISQRQTDRRSPEDVFPHLLVRRLDPKNGQLQYANAGHDLPYHRHHKADVTELRATGMPLGLMPDMKYEEKETRLTYGESILFYSDGIVEAHDPDRRMYSFPRLMKLVGDYDSDTSLKDTILEDLAEFTGPHWEQEDDITMVTLQRSEGYGDPGCQQIYSKDGCRGREKRNGLATAYRIQSAKRTWQRTPGYGAGR